MTPEQSARWATPDRIRELSRERFKPWPLPDSLRPRKSYDPWHSRPVTDGGEISRGFARNERFAVGGEKVIAGTNRQKTRASRALVVKEQQ